MKKLLLINFYIILVCLFGIPLVVLSGSDQPVPENQKNQLTVRVLDKQTGQLRNMFIEEYLTGVVAAEMPAEFELEALKAQAIAARTYTVRRMFVFGAKPNPDHPEAEVCTDPTHCQAWISSDEQKKKWGSVKYYTHVNKIKTAVKLTERLVAIYNEAFIDPVYHGSCGGKGTENSEDVWSVQIPYLRSVDCAQEYKAGEQKTAAEITRNKLIEALGRSTAVPVLVGSSGNSIEILKKSARGRVQEAVVFGKEISGTELRKILGLGSTFINWEVKGDKVLFESTGKGHAVGMCQYGANGMALAGKSYKDIIHHYYTNVKITKLKY